MDDIRGYTIYRINLDDYTARVWKYLTCTEEEAKREMRKYNNFLQRTDHGAVFILRDDQPRERLVIPVI